MKCQRKNKSRSMPWKKKEQKNSNNSKRFIQIKYPQRNPQRPKTKQNQMKK